MNLISLLSRLWLIALIVFLCISCGGQTHTPNKLAAGKTYQELRALIPKTPEEAKYKWESLLGSEEIRQARSHEPCIAAAWDRILSSRRMYNVDRSGFNESTGEMDVYIGSQLLVLPSRYVNLVSSGYEHGTPGAGAVLTFPIEDLVKIANPRRIFNKHPDKRVVGNALLKINCVMNLPWPKGQEPWTWDRDKKIKAALFIPVEDDRPRKITERVLKEFGLIEYRSSDRRFDTAYLPIDRSLRVLDGGLLSISCPRQYSPSAARDPLDWSLWRCHIPVNLMTGGGGAEFSLYYLPYWREIHEGLLKIMNEALKEQG
jgi:hypothetical protein